MAFTNTSDPNLQDRDHITKIKWSWKSTSCPKPFLITSVYSFPELIIRNK